MVPRNGRPQNGRKEIAVPGNRSTTITFCVEHLISAAQEAIEAKNAFYIALSGGTTPKSIFQLISSEKYRHRIDWEHIYLFWSDERAVPPTHPDSNFAMAMSSGLQNVPLHPDRIFRMKGEEKDLEAEAKHYEQLIRQVVPKATFDFIMLGMGEDGHIASLFPFTEALDAKNKLVAANYIPQKEAWRMTLTFDCFDLAKTNVIYILGTNKAETVKTVVEHDYEPDRYPVQRVGLPENRALWILDEDAASLI